jgi:hypothetical protein
MIRSHLTTLIPALALSALAMASLSVAAPDDDTPPPNSAPGADAPRSGPHHNPAWQACNKQADDQNITAKDARREFMRSCMKSAKEAPPPPPSS